MCAVFQYQNRITISIDQLNNYQTHPNLNRRFTLKEYEFDFCPRYNWNLQANPTRGCIKSKFDKI